MNTSTSKTVQQDSYVTLHYRVALPDGEDVISTFDDHPATFHIGHGQLAVTLERALYGMQEGQRQQFQLAPESAFGQHNPDLVQSVSLHTLRENSAADEAYAVGDQVEFNAPGGGTYVGTLRELGETVALFDFNHPLAGKPILFEAQIIGIL